MAITGSSSKRRAREEVSDDEEERNNAALIKRVKRERAEEAAQEYDEEMMEDEDEGGEDEEEDVDLDAILNKDDSDSDSEDEEDAHQRMQRELQDDEGNIAAYERYQAKRKRMEQFGRASDAGVIKSVTVVNFMNHAHTTVDFSPKMNFLVGHNGSGKSAILTAITIALGGKAAITGRGTGLKDLIRKGRDKATITLTLNNSGDEAYKPELYKDTIVIERTLSANGSSQYKFRAARDGRILATKRDELTQILDHFSITIDSPLTILTQDAARSFLANATDKSLYDFFLEGTSLSRLAELYEKLDQIDASIESILEGTKDQLQRRQEEKNELTRKAQASAKLVELQARSNRLHHELAWAYVNAKEQEVLDSRDAVAQCEDLLAETERRAAKFEAQAEPLKAEIDEMESALQKLNASRVPLEKKKNKAKDGAKNAKMQLRKQRQIIAELTEAIEDRKREIESVSKSIADEESGRTEEDPKQVAKRQQVTKMEEAQAKFNVEYDHLDRLVGEQDEALQRLTSEEADLQGQVNQYNKEVNNHRSNVSNLEQQSKSRLATFGSNLEHVFREFDHARWVHSRPLGPLGMHVQLEDQKYQDVMSSLLGANMCSFAVRCPQDKQTLMDILRRCAQTRGYRSGLAGAGGIPPIIQHTGDLFDYSSGDMSRVGETVLSKLKFDNEEVLRIIIVQNKIESSFVASTVDNADEMLRQFYARGIQSASVYTANRYNVSISGSLATRGFRNIERWQGNRMFTKDVATAIREERPKLEAATKLRDEAQEALRKATAAKNDMTNKLAETRRKLATVKSKQAHLRAQLPQLKQQLEVVDGNFALDALLENRKNLESELGAMEGGLQAQQDNLQPAQALIDKFVEEEEECSRQLAEIEPRQATQAEAMRALLERRDDTNREAKHWASSKETHRTKLAMAQQLLRSRELEAVDWAAAAGEDGSPRVDTTRDCKTIEAEHNAAVEAITKAKESGIEDQMSVLRRLQQIKALYRKEQSDHVGLANFRDFLKKAIRARKKWWDGLRHHNALRVKTLFIVSTDKRGFEGRAEFDHKNRTLRLNIQTSTQNKSGNSQWKLPKNLSGGERSFSTVALLLAMWDVTTCPIRCLDEWDVFLDLVNRKIAASILIEGAMQSEGKQFVLITPQDMAGIQLGPGMKVTRLNDPERNQATLPFGPG